MANFNFTVNVSEQGPKISAALGVNGSSPLTVLDLGKAVSLAAGNNYVVASDGDDIEGILESVEDVTKNGGFGFGTVYRNGRVEVQVAAAEVGTATVGSFVIAGIQIAVGTAGACMVKLGAGTAFKWRVIDIISGTGVAGDTVLIERV